MKTDHQPEAGFLRTITRAVSKLKNRLQRDYEEAYPGFADIIRIILDEEEAKAWELSFPHLLLPDLVEAHIATLNLQSVATHRETVRESRELAELPMYRPAFA
jgi:hypothetical protein